MASLNILAVGAAAMNPVIARRWEEMGVVSLQGYGATETSPVVAFTRMERNRVGTVGEVIPGVEVRISPEGEIQVRGPNVFQGYWQRPDATAAVMQDGWYRTGDQGTLDEQGFLTLQGRQKDMLVMPDGTKVHPADIEQALIRDARVRDAAVVGLERPGSEIQVHAVLILHAPDEADDVVRVANSQLGGHQQIRGFTVWPEEEFPRTPTLKVKKPQMSSGCWQPRPPLPHRPGPMRPPSPAAPSSAWSPSWTASRPTPFGQMLDSRPTWASIRSAASSCWAWSRSRWASTSMTASWTRRRRWRSCRPGSMPPPPDSAAPEGIFGWPLNPVVGALRIGLQTLIILPLVSLFYRRPVRGREHLDGLQGPVMFAANHHLHNDNALILMAIPLAWRWKLSVAAAADTIFALVARTADCHPGQRLPAGA